MHLKSREELIAADHPVRSIWRYVCSLNLSAFYRDIEAVQGGAGRDAVDPPILLALWLYATVEGESSARHLAELCERDFAYQWICGEVGVNRDMLNTFRHAHPEALDALLTETIGSLLHHDLVSLKRAAQDGMRVRASAGKSSFRRQATTNEGGDSGQMEPMITSIEEKFGRRPEEYLVDGGFSSREDTTQLEQRGVKVDSPIKKEQKLLEQGEDPYARCRGD